VRADEDMRGRLELSLQVVDAPLPDADAAVRRGKRLRMRARIVAAVVGATALLAVAIPLAWLSTLGERPGHESVAGDHGRLAVNGHVALEPGVTDLAFHDGSVWVAGAGGVVTRVDAKTDAITARIDVAGIGDHGRIAIGEGSVWVTAPELRDDGTRGNLVRIDPSTNEIVATIHVGGPISGLGIGGGWVWVTRPEAGPGTLFRVDPDTDRVVDHHSVGVSPGRPIYAYGYVWVASTDAIVSVSKIDPASGKVVAVVDTPPVQSSGDGSLWAVGDDSIVRLDPASGGIQATIPMERAASVFVDGTTVWVLVMARSSDPDLFYPIAGTAAVARIDTATNQVVGEPLLVDDLQPLALTAGSAQAWIGDFSGGVITRVGEVPA
jgi:hypothetical protein